MVLMVLLQRALCLIPRTLWDGFGQLIARLITKLKPELQKVAIENLTLAFPEKSVAEKEHIFFQSLISFVNVFIDGLFIARIDRKWVEKNVDFAALDKVTELRKAHPDNGLILATGHLGSFELFGHCLGLLGFPVSAVAREMKPAFIDRWWNSLRAKSGNTGIPRTGALKEMIKGLREKRFVALLMDQNVRDKHAVFVPWFGKLAATTGAIALSTMRTKAPVIVLFLHREGKRYRIVHEELSLEDLTGRSAASVKDRALDQKAYEITDRVSEAFQRLIKRYPEEWFWFHKRFKTRPLEELPQLREAQL